MQPFDKFAVRNRTEIDLSLDAVRQHLLAMHSLSEGCPTMGQRC